MEFSATMGSEAGCQSPRSVANAGEANGVWRLHIQNDTHHWICRCLDKRDRLILTLYHYESLSMLEVGQSIGCSESRVSQRLQHIYKALRFWLNEHPEELKLMAG